MDEIQLQLVISAQVDRVLAGVGAFEKALTAVEKAHQSAGVQAERHSKLLENLGGSMQRLTQFANVFVAFEAIKSGLAAFDGLEKHNIDLLRTTEILGGNATAASTWSVVAHEMGLELDQIDKAFAKLSTAMNSGSNPALKQMGIAAEDVNGKLRPLNDVINAAADYFHAHAGAVNNAALANALFGRSGYQLLPILEQGTAGLSRLTDEARKYGLVLDATTIERNAAFTFQLKETQLALDGVGLAIGNAALPGIAALGQGLSRLIEDNLPAFVAMINRAVSYLVGFIEGITGLTLHVGEGALALSSLSNITGSTGSAMDGASGSAQALADAIQRIRDRTKAATDAIDDQVAALQRQQQVQSFLDQQAKLQEQLANKAHDIDKLREQQYQQFWLGNFSTAKDIGEQITQAHQSQSDIQQQISVNTVAEQTKNQVNALQDQKKSIEEAATKQIEAMQRAARGTTAALTAAANGIPPLFNQAGLSAGLGFATNFDAEKIGTQMGQKLEEAFLGPVIGYKTSGKGGNVQTEIRGNPRWQEIGQAVGEAIASGMTTALGKGFTAWLDKVKAALVGAGVSPEQAYRTNPARQGYAEGGYITGGPEGSRVPVDAHVGELLLNRRQQASLAQNMVTDMTETNRLLRAILEQSRQGSSGSTTGADAFVSAVMERARGNRSRVGAGAFGS